MRSDNLKFLLPDYLTGSLTDAEKRSVEERIVNDSSFRMECERLATTMKMLDESRKSEATPLALQNILVQINAKIDEPASSTLLGIIPTKVAVPVLALVAILVVVIISLPSQMEPTLPMISASEIESTLQSTELPELVALQSEIEDDYILPDLLMDEQLATLQSALDEDLTSSINEEIFDDLSYDDLLAASRDYLSDNDLVESLSEQSLGKLLEAVGDKTLL
jgi:hypothetical protein